MQVSHVTKLSILFIIAWTIKRVDWLTTVHSKLSGTRMDVYFTSANHWSGVSKIDEFKFQENTIIYTQLCILNQNVQFIVYQLCKQ